MKYFIIAGLILNSNLTFSQDTIISGMGSKNFDHLYAAIKQDCGFENEYAGVKFNRKKVKKDLWIVSVVNDIIMTNLSIKEADSILKKRGIKPFIQPYNRDGYSASSMIINGTYIKFRVISATKKEAPVTFLGATLKSTYEIYCKTNPLFVIPSVNIDVDFFKNKVMKKISCRYEIYNDLELGVANFMASELHFIF